MRSADLQGKRVRTEDGEPLGRVSEIRIRDGEVISIVCGARGLLQRFASTSGGRRVPWSAVVRVTPDEIVVRAHG